MITQRFLGGLSVWLLSLSLLLAWLSSAWLSPTSAANPANPANPITHPMSVGWQTNQTWWTQQTPHFILYAPESLVDQLPRVAVLAEQVHQELSQTLNWTPSRKTHLVLSDDVDSANGWASVYPFNQNRLFISAPDAINSLEDYRDWLALLIRHEYTHSLHLDQARGLPAALRAVFGRQVFSFPHQFQPLWMIEGLAIEQETDARLGVGRGQSDYYAMQMRAEVARGLVSVGRVSGLNRDWPAGQAYLYGAYFYRFLAEVYGEQALELWLRSYSYNLIPYWMNPTARRVWGEDFKQVWNRYQAWLRYHYSPLAAGDSDSLGEAISNISKISNQGGRSYAGVWRNQSLYRIEADGHAMPRLIEQRWQQGIASQREIARTAYPGAFDVSSQGRVVMSQMRDNRQNRYYADLWLWDVSQSGRASWQRLTHHQRYRQALWLGEDKLIARRQVAGVSELHLLSDQGALLEVLWQGDEQTVLGQMDKHPTEQKILAMKKTAFGSWQLAEFDLVSKQWQWLTNNSFNQADPSYSTDGRSVVFSANYTSVYQVYQLDRATSEVFGLTNITSGAFQPLLTEQGDLVYRLYSAQGYDWVELAKINQIKQNIKIPENNNQAWLEKTAVLTEDGSNSITLSAPKAYQPYSSLRPQAWWPIFNLSETRTQWGVMLDGQDALATHHYQLTLAYDDLAQLPYGQLSYQVDNRYLIQLQRSWQEGYNRLNPDELVLLRARDQAVFARLNLMNFQHDQLALHLGLVHEKTRDAWRDPRLSSQSIRQRGDISAVLHWDSTQAYRYSISPASGWQGYWALDSHALKEGDYAGYRVQFDLKHYWHIHQSQVLFTRLAAGYAQDTAHPFVLGSDTGVFSTSLFARTDYPLRGYAASSIIDNRFVLGSVEYRAPLARIQQNWQVYPLGVRDLYGQIFFDNAQTQDMNLSSLGAQLTLEAVIGYRMLWPLNLGFAQGLDKNLGQRQLWLSTQIDF